MDLNGIWTLNVNLGGNCNLSCKYCMQHGLLDRSISYPLSGDFLKFLVDSTQTFDVNHNSTSMHGLLEIRFTGGEPLLYFEEMKKIVETLVPYNKCHYSTVTNGTLLTQEIVNFLNKYNILISLSNDGPRTTEFRGVNVLDDKKIVDLVKQLKRFSIICNLNSKNCNHQELIDYFNSFFGSEVKVNINPVYDTGMCDKDILKFDFDQYESDLKSFLSQITPQDILDKDTTAVKLVLKYATRIRSLIRNPDLMNHFACGNDCTHINLDTIGNIYFCRNSSELVGHINEFKSVKDIFNKIKISKKEAYNITHSKECNDCEVSVLCGGNCSYVSEYVRKEYFCRLQKITLTHFLNKIKECGK